MIESLLKSGKGRGLLALGVFLTGCSRSIEATDTIEPTDTTIPLTEAVLPTETALVDTYPVLSQEELFNKEPEARALFEQWSQVVKEDYPSFEDSELRAFGIAYPGEVLPPAIFFEGRDPETGSYVLSQVKEDPGRDSGVAIVALSLIRQFPWEEDDNTYDAFGYFKMDGMAFVPVPVFIFIDGEIIFADEDGFVQSLTGKVGGVGEARQEGDEIIEIRTGLVDTE